MKMLTHKYLTKDALVSFIEKEKLLQYDNIFIQIFSGVLEKKKLLDMAAFLKKHLNNAQIIGTTTSGEIDNSSMQDGTILLSFTLLKSTVVRSKLYDFDESSSLESLKKELLFEDTKALIIFSDGLKSDTELFLNELHDICPDIMIAGGRAGDNSKFKETFVFNEHTATENGCVIATLSGDDLIVNTDYLLNWTAIGKEMLVTKCKGNVIYQLDGIDILDVYEKYLGKDIIADLPASCMSFPLIMQKDTLCVARDPIAVVEKKALAFAGHFEEGNRVRFSFANIGDLVDNLEEHFDKLLKYPSQVVYVYSCVARKNLLQEKLQDELNLLSSLAPSSGFFTYGEFFQSKDTKELLNVTTTFMILSESKKLHKRSLKHTPKMIVDPIKKALTHLVQVTTHELEEVSTHDDLTGLYNKAEYLKAIERSIVSAQRYDEPFGLILIDIDHFKLINDNYGHAVGDIVLQDLAKVLKKSIRSDDFLARWGGEEFIIIVRHVRMNELEKLVKKLQRNINKITILDLPKITVSYGVTAYKEGDRDESLFKRADNALYVAKESGRNRYIVR